MDRELFHWWNKNNDKRVIIQLKSSTQLHTPHPKLGEWKIEILSKRKIEGNGGMG